jgi:tetratricopeptide (TPR) repeat protein
MPRARAKHGSKANKPERDTAHATTPTRARGFDWPTTAAVFLVALILRAIYLFQSSRGPTFLTPIIDADTYNRLARTLAAGHLMEKGLFWQTFFYPVFLAFVYALSHASIWTAKLVQTLLGALTCVLTYDLGRRLFDRRVGILAALITACYGPLIFFDGELLGAGWETFWSVALVLLLLRLRDHPSTFGHLALGVCGVLAVLTRATFLPFLIAACAWLAIVRLRTTHTWRPPTACLLCIIAGFAALALPVAAMNYTLNRHFGILPASGGVNFFIGNNPQHDRLVTIQPGDDWERLNLLPEQYGFTGQYGKSRYFYARTRDYLVAHPLAFLARLVHKTLQFASSREIPRNVDIYVYTQWSTLLRALVWKIGRFGFPFGVLLPLAIAGLVLRWSRIAWPLRLFLLLYPLSVILVFVVGRYRVPIVPIVAVIAAAGALALVQSLRSRAWSQAIPAVVVAAAATFVATYPAPFAEEQLDFHAPLYRCLADVHAAAGQTDQALACYNRALELRPDYAQAYNNRGVVLLEHQNPTAAIDDFRAALRIQPDYPRAQANLAFALSAQNHFDEALPHFVEALRQEPYSPRAPEIHVAIARILSYQGKPDEAITHLEMALHLRPTEPGARRELAATLFAAGRFDESIAAYRTLLQAQPNDASLHEDLGLALCRNNALNDGIQEYREALRLAPTRTSARLKLALALEQHGHFDSAIQEYRAVLRRDPQNALARAHLAALRKPQTAPAPSP